MTDCIFCKILHGEIPCRKLYEDDLVLAFSDIQPQAPVHILLIPKTHISSLESVTEADASLLGHLLLTASRLAKEQNLTEGWRIVSNTGAHGGQTVPHLHFHLLGGKALVTVMA